MKKAIIAIIAALGFLILACFLYLIYKTWVVFGFWTIVWTGFVNMMASVLLGQLIGSRNESNGRITYNPKEWPKFLNMAICAVIGVYLYSIISKPNVDRSNYYFGLAYLTLLTALPIVKEVYRLIRDRNDFVEIEGDSISYRDNEKTGKFKFSDIKSVDTGSDLTLHFNDGSDHKIALSNMNFNAADLVSLTLEINSRVPKPETSEQKA